MAIVPDSLGWPKEGPFINTLFLQELQFMCYLPAAVDLVQVKI